MAKEGRGRLFRRKDGKYLLYLPVDFCSDSTFPFQDLQETRRGAYSLRVRVAFKPGEKVLTVTEWKD